MAEPLIAPLTPGLVLTGGYIVRLAALNPTTGATVAGVTVSGVSMQVDTVEPDAPDVKLPDVTPLFAYGSGN